LQHVQSQIRASTYTHANLLETWKKSTFLTKSIPPFHGPCLVLSNRVLRDYFLQEATLEAATRYHRKTLVISFSQKSIFLHFPKICQKPSKDHEQTLLFHHLGIILSSFQPPFFNCKSFLWTVFAKHHQWQKLFASKPSHFKPNLLHHSSFEDLWDICFRPKTPNNDCINIALPTW
jgi:hypothetical protein